MFDSQKDEFKLIKVRFTELSEFIKDVRFVRNIKEYNKGNENFDAISFMKKARKIRKKMNFDKPQVVTKEEEDKYIINNNINISYAGEKSNNNKILEIIDKDEDEDEDEDKVKDKDKVKDNDKDKDKVKDKDKDKDKDKVKDKDKHKVKVKDKDKDKDKFKDKDKDEDEDKVKDKNKVKDKDKDEDEDKVKDKDKFKDKDKDEDEDKVKDKDEDKVKDKNEDKDEEYKNIKIDENNDVNNDEKKIQVNKIDKKKYNIKLNIVDSNANSKKSSIKNTNNTDSNNNKTFLSAKSRNYKNSLNSEKKTNERRKFDFLRKESSSYSITNKKDKFFIRTQSQFYFISKIHQEPEFYKMKPQKTQENFHPKINNIIATKIEKSLFREEGGSDREESKFRNILVKNENIDFKELLKIFTNFNKDNNSNYLVLFKIIKFLNNKIIELNQRINELNSWHKVSLERLNKKIQLCLELNNSTLLKFKREKLMKKDYQNIYNNYEINIPLITKNNSSNNHKCLVERDKSKVKIKSLENSSSLYLQESDKKFTSGKVLRIIEPYLIKKFKENSSQGKA